MKESLRSEVEQKYADLQTIVKNGENNQIDNYRPMHLTSSGGKFFYESNQRNDK